jgi:hypothetical protein
MGRPKFFGLLGGFLANPGAQATGDSAAREPAYYNVCARRGAGRTHRESRGRFRDSGPAAAKKIAPAAAKGPSRSGGGGINSLK